MHKDTHRIITQRAFELSKTFLSDSLYNVKDEVIAGSSDEDDFSVSRALNWHFFRSSTRMCVKYWHIFNVSSENRVEEKIKELKANKPNILGRFIHHVQDMSTPSHVIPIYHGPKLPRYFSLGKIEDPFERYLLTQSDVIARFDVNTADIFQSANSGSQDSLYRSFFSLYKERARDMLESILLIDQHIPIEERPYREFWKHYSEKEDHKLKGFGKFGEKSAYFTEKPDFIASKECQTLRDKIIRHAVTGTVKALHLADELIYRKM